MEEDIDTKIGENYIKQNTKQKSQVSYILWYIFQHYEHKCEHFM